MPVKDRFELASIAIESVLNQISTIDELIIVDDESTISAENYFQEIKRRGAAKAIAIRFLRNDTNCGVSASRNRGFHASQGDVVCFCDSDDFWTPYKISHVRRVFEDEKIKIYFHAFLWAYGTLWLFKLFPRERLLKLPRFMIVIFGFLNPSCLSLRRETFGEGFNENMRYHEDLDFVLTMSFNYSIYFFNFPFMNMGRPPGSTGGATENDMSMRVGAIAALRRLQGCIGLKIIAAVKIKYHQLKCLQTKQSIKV